MECLLCGLDQELVACKECEAFVSNWAAELKTIK